MIALSGCFTRRCYCSRSQKYYTEQRKSVGIQVTKIEMFYNENKILCQELFTSQYFFQGTKNSTHLKLFTMS